MKKRLIRIAAAAIAGVAGLTVLTLVGCVRTSGETWYFKSAALPEEWPDLTPIGKVEIREYPTYRVATVTADDAGGGMGPMFNTLFNHIKSNDIAMTAPVDMGYAEPERDGMTSMGFLYRTMELGQPGQDGTVVIRDVAPQSFASVGVRGSYSQKHFDRSITLIETWLTDQAAWEASGPPRYLGYNGPFVPWFWKYGEVQIPVAPNATNPPASTPAPE